MINPFTCLKCSNNDIEDNNTTIKIKSSCCWSKDNKEEIVININNDLDEEKLNMIKELILKLSSNNI